MKCNMYSVSNEEFLELIRRSSSIKDVVFRQGIILIQVKQIYYFINDVKNQGLIGKKNSGQKIVIKQKERKKMSFVKILLLTKLL